MIKIELFFFKELFCASLQGKTTGNVVKLKLPGIAPNRSKNHIGEITTDRLLQVGFLYIENTFAFLN